MGVMTRVISLIFLFLSTKFCQVIKEQQIIVRCAALIPALVSNIPWELIGERKRNVGLIDRQALRQ
jgi:hypothetical protein